MVVIRRTEVITTAARNWLAVGLLAWAAIGGGGRLIALATGTQSGPATGIPGWLDVTWHLLLLAGGVAGLTGLFWVDAITGLLIERAAMWPLGAGAAVYAVGMALAGQQVRPTAIVGLFAVMFILQALQISATLRDRATLERPDA